MSVRYCLYQAGVKMGLDPAVEGDRAVLLRFLNEASSELYDQSDMDGTQMEQLFRVNGDQQIALPTYVGPLRAMREYSTHVPWHLYNMRPRYNQINWKDRWRSWRLKGTSALSYPLVNQSNVVVSVAQVETPPIVVSVSGPTLIAANDNEQITMDELATFDPINKVYLKQSVKQFADISAFKKNRTNICDVNLQDIDGIVLSTIPNNHLIARFRLIDVSLYPWSNVDVGPVDHYMEVLYKKALQWFTDDDDEYPAFGYDNIIVNKMLQLWMEEQGKAEAAAAYDAKATRSLARKQQDQDRGIEEEAALVENCHDTLLPRNRVIGPARYQGQIYY